MTIKQLSVFLENKTGRINDVAKTLAKYDINMHAFSMAESTDFGILRLIVSDVDKAVEVLRAENLSAGNDTPINEKVSVLSSSRFTLSHVQYTSVRVYVCPFPSVDVTTRVCMVYRSVILVSIAYSPSKSSAETGCSAIRLP